MRVKLKDQGCVIRFTKIEEMTVARAQLGEEVRTAEAADCRRIQLFSHSRKHMRYIVESIREA